VLFKSTFPCFSVARALYHARVVRKPTDTRRYAAAKSPHGSVSADLASDELIQLGY